VLIAAFPLYSSQDFLSTLVMQDYSVGELGLCRTHQAKHKSLHKLAYCSVTIRWNVTFRCEYQLVILKALFRRILHSIHRRERCLKEYRYKPVL